MPFEEVVEAEGHLIDSHVMEQIFDKVVESNGRFEVEQFRIGRTNSEPSYLRLRLEAPNQQQMEHLLAQILPIGCSQVDGGDAVLKPVERDRCAPEDFYSTSNHHTFIRIKGEWVEVQNQRMDAMIVVNGEGAYCRRLRDLKAGDRSSSACAASASPRNRKNATASPSPSCRMKSHPSARWKPPFARPPRSRARRKNRAKPSSPSQDPVVVHTGGVSGLTKLIREGWIGAVLSGNALGVHDIESALLGTSLGVRMADGRQAEHGHRNHMRAINAIYHAGGIRGAVGAAG